MPSESVNEKALTLIDQRRVRLVLPTRQGDPPGAVILGGEADYAVWFHQDGVACDCYAGTDHLPGEPRCSHAVAAMIVWADVLALPDVKEAIR